MISTLHPIGYISLHAGDHDAYGVIRPWIMTDHGWRLADGLWYNRGAYPRLWEALPDRRRGDEVQVPNLSNEGKPYGRVVQLAPAQMPAHTHNTFANPSPHAHTIAPLHELRQNPRYDPYFMQRHSHGYVAAVDPASGLFHPRPVGKIQRVDLDERGLNVQMRLDDWIAEEIKKATLSVDDLRTSLGLKGLAVKAAGNQEDLFPDPMPLHVGVKGMRWGASRTSASANVPSTTKENNRMTVKLKTPSKNIKRKDLTAALQLLEMSGRDELLNAVALVQELGDDQKILRAYQLKDADVIGDRIKVNGAKVSGVLSDVSGDYQYGDINLVVDGKMHVVNGNIFVTVTNGLLGDDIIKD